MSQQFPTYNTGNPWVAGPTGQPQPQYAAQPAQPQFFVPQQPPQPPQPQIGSMGQPTGIAYGAGPAPVAGGSFLGGGGGGAPGGMAMDPFLTGVAGNMLRQQGQSYLQRGQAFMQSKMGFLSGSSFHYLFSINPDYVRSKLLMLSAPFLKRWSYVRVLEQISGGHKYLPPRQDANAPDLYIPIMAIWTYCVLIGIAALARSGPTGGFKPEVIYNTVSSSCGAWLAHTLLLKMLLYMLGISGAIPFLELAAYAGYPFVPACVTAGVQLATSSASAYHAVWAYGSLCAAIFLVRSMKRVILQEAHTYSIDNTRHTYLLLGLAILQFPLNAWLGRLPPSVVGKAAGAAGAAGKAVGKAFKLL